MALASYADLVSEMGDWLNRSDLTPKIPTFVRLFEARMNRRLRNPDMEQTFTVTMDGVTTTFAINSRVRELREVFLSSSNDQEINYTITGETIVFDSAPGVGDTLNYSGYVTLPSLETNSVNWLLTDHPDLYLFGSLARAEAYLKDDERLSLWKAAEDEVLSELLREGNQRRMPAGPLRATAAVIESPGSTGNWRRWP